MISNCLLNVFGLWMFDKILCADLCWFLKKICRIKRGNNYKTENVLKKIH